MRNGLVVAVALALHALLLLLMLHRSPQRVNEPRGPAMVMVNVAPPRKPMAPQVSAQPAPLVRHKAAPAGAPAALAAPVPAPRVEAEAPPAPPPSAETMLSIAKRDLGKIDKELRQEFKPAPLSASADNALQRLSQGIDQAHELGSNKWYQGARIEDYTPPGDDARKIYKITTALGTYCVRYADKNKPGYDHGQANLGEPLVGACPHMMKGR